MSTHDVLFELGTEELPPRTLLSLSVALEEGIVNGLDNAAIPHAAAQRFATPRRLAVRVLHCAEHASDRPIERRGPPVTQSFDAGGTATAAAVAFAKSCGVEVSALSRLSTEKGVWLAHRGTEAGAATVSLLGSIVTQAVAALPIAKRMRWGARSAEFVRPVRTVVLLFGQEVVPLELFGLASGRLTLGHRFHAPRPIALKSPQHYERRLRQAKVIADFGKRRELVRVGVHAAAAQVGGTALIADALLDEVTALVEWPVPIAGRFEQRFLALPREVVIATVQDHQRYFPIESADGVLSGGFVTVSNIQSRDPAKVREGNERVVRPRLSDAVFFWEQDCKVSLETHAARLGEMVFQTKLGTYLDKTHRIKNLARLIGDRIGAGPEVGRAAELAKADLMTAMVGEFPELQGTMGRYYAQAQGEPAEVALAIEEHYQPRHAGDGLPVTKAGQALAVADRIDTLVGIFAIELRPTGTKDPFGLRRAAVGLLRILLEAHLQLDLTGMLEAAAAAQPVKRPAVVAEVYDFIAERLRGLLLERPGVTVEMVDSVLVGRHSSPHDVDNRLAALSAFLLMPEAAALSAINKRIANILRKANSNHTSELQVRLLTEDAEIRLHGVLAEVGAVVAHAVAARRYDEALRALGGLRAPVDEFFERVMVMDNDLERRNNRLALLQDVKRVLVSVADLSRLPG